MSPDIYLSLAHILQFPSPSQAGVMSYYTDKAYSAQFLANSKGLEEMIVRKEASEEHVKDGKVGDIRTARLLTQSSQSSCPNDNYASDNSRKHAEKEIRFSRHSSYMDTIESDAKNTPLLSFKRWVKQII